MDVRRLRPSIAASLAILLLAAGGARADGLRDVRDLLGPRFEASRHQHPHPLPTPPTPGTDAVRRWNRIAIDASGLDHTPRGARRDARLRRAARPGPREPRDGDRAHRDLRRGERDRRRLPELHAACRRRAPGTSLDAAIAQAAHDTLVAMFPSQAATFDALLAEDLARIRDRGAREGARHRARAARGGGDPGAARRRRLRSTPSRAMGIDFIPSDEPGKWRQDPISQIPLALGAHWGEVEPFVLALGRPVPRAAAAGARAARSTRPRSTR